MIVNCWTKKIGIESKMGKAHTFSSVSNRITHWNHSTSVFYLLSWFEENNMVQGNTMFLVVAIFSQSLVILFLTHDFETGFLCCKDNKGYQQRSLVSLYKVVFFLSVVSRCFKRPTKSGKWRHPFLFESEICVGAC